MARQHPPKHQTRKTGNPRRLSKKLLIAKRERERKRKASESYKYS